MRKLVQLAVLLAGTILFGAACAHTGPKFADTPIPALNAGQARIFVYRKGVMFGAAIQPKVKLNGERIGKTVPGGFFFVDRDPGDYKISSATEVEECVMLHLTEGQTNYVRMNIRMGIVEGRLVPELVDPRVGEKQISKCRYTGGIYDPH